MSHSISLKQLPKIKTVNIDTYATFRPKIKVKLSSSKLASNSQKRLKKLFKPKLSLTDFAEKPETMAPLTKVSSIRSQVKLKLFQMENIENPTKKICNASPKSPHSGNTLKFLKSHQKFLSGCDSLKSILNQQYTFQGIKPPKPISLRNMPSSLLKTRLPKENPYSVDYSREAPIHCKSYNKISS